ncbi:MULTISPECIES: YgiT-type zinc finger protein [Desulfofundulus]|nr:MULTISPECIES: YgiT-type zinc finger protein [Desulfofundulus]NHM26994.1 YgiT-type zinc finger protein [Desulfofundulus sp. TPOSR]NHM28989.1 YgiT-type zinc finger protein [Desulfofundulus sp. TPOSR]
MEKLELVGICAGCYYENAELRFKEKTLVKDGAALCLKRIPYYYCPRCGEETYDLDVEVFVERAIKRFTEGNGKGETIDVGNLFRVPSESAVQ